MGHRGLKGDLDQASQQQLEGERPVLLLEGGGFAQRWGHEGQGGRRAGTGEERRNSGTPALKATETHTEMSLGEKQEVVMEHLLGKEINQNPARLS